MHANGIGIKGLFFFLSCESSIEGLCSIELSIEAMSLDFLFKQCNDQHALSYS